MDFVNEPIRWQLYCRNVGVFESNWIVCRNEIISESRSLQAPVIIFTDKTTIQAHIKTHRHTPESILQGVRVQDDFTVDFQLAFT